MLALFKVAALVFRISVIKINCKLELINHLFTIICMKKRAGLENFTEKDMDKLRELEGHEALEPGEDDMDTIDLMKCWLLLGTLAVIVSFILAVFVA